MRTPPRAVFFDLDDTLYDFATAARTALWTVSERVSRELGIPAEEVRSEYARLLRRQMAENPTAGCHSRTIRFQLFLEERHLPVRLALDYSECYWTTLVDHAVRFDGVSEALEFLRAHGICVGLGTNMSADWQLRKIVRLGIADLLDVVVTSEEAAAEKPAEAFFAYCARKAGVAPEECLFVGDNLEGDVLGARAAGMDALWFQPDAAQRASHPDIPSFGSYREAPFLFLYP